ncbi:MAG: cytochrome c biogenesis protein CcsA [Bacteroidaceae bacterium]|nr:cytochrome c biogenesis protein CcsA [Bacteroidaceae bacterium]
MLKKPITALYILIIILLAIATIYERQHGTEAVCTTIYRSWWFSLLWALLSVLSAFAIFVRRLYRRLAVFLLHVSFLVILSGAFLTHTLGKEGYVHLRAGLPETTYIDKESKNTLPLPFTLRLDTFYIVHYSGTTAPQDYVSELTCITENQSDNATVSMNNIYIRDGYRFYQSSFDYDGYGTWLSMSYDPWGIGVTYFGYAMMALSMVCILFSRKERFLHLLRSPLLRGGSLLLLLLLSQGMSANRKIATINEDKAKLLRREQVIYNDRVAPFNTLARDFLIKIYRKPTYKGLSAEQVVSGWTYSPADWKDEPMIYIKSSELRELLHIEGKYARLSDLFDGEEYKLTPLIQRYQRQEKLSKAIEEVDEKVGLILMVTNGTLIVPLPSDGSVERLSEMKVDAELLYNSIPFTKILFMLNLTVGIIGFLLLLFMGASRVGRRHRVVYQTQFVVLIISLIFHSISYGLRWYISGRIPLGNGYETMIFMALVLMILTLLLCRRFPFALPFGFLLSGFTLLVAYLSEMNPQITPLMPVLNSPILSSHVSIIMIAYALLAFLLLNGIYCLILLWRRHKLKAENTGAQTFEGTDTGLRNQESIATIGAKIEQLTLLSRLLLYPAVFCLSIGIFLGAIWANVSWGSYWSWDPKEVWALITMMVYGVPFHDRLIRGLRRPALFHGYLVVAFLVVLMTYFGVNYLLGGMHSYANA